MWLIVGLGNPGLRYQQDRHNIGFHVLAQLCQQHDIPLSRRQFQGLVGHGRIEDQRVLLVQPQTYMNLSGQCIAPLVQTHQIPLSQILVIHDELDLPFGRMLLKQGGGSGGHNGLKSLDEELGSRDYARLRFGIGRPEDPDQDIAAYVLSPFAQDQQETLVELLTQATEMVETCCTEGLNKAMNRWNRRKKKKPKPEPIQNPEEEASPPSEAQHKNGEQEE